MRYSDRVDYLKKLFDSKLNKAHGTSTPESCGAAIGKFTYSRSRCDIQGGHTARPEQYSISNEATGLSCA